MTTPYARCLAPADGAARNRFAPSSSALPTRRFVCEAAAYGIFFSNSPLEHTEGVVNPRSVPFSAGAGRCEEYWMRSANLAVGVLCALMLSLTPAAAKRVALVVGIDTYDNFSPDLQLKKAVNDARAVSAAFKELGFQVIAAENTKRDGFLKAWQ